MSDTPSTDDQAIRVIADVIEDVYDNTWDGTDVAAAILAAIQPLLADRDRKVRADEREAIAASIGAVDPIEWALAGQDAGRIAVDIARSEPQDRWMITEPCRQGGNDE